MTQVEIRNASVLHPPSINPERLNLIIRTDRRFATATIKEGILSYLKAKDAPAISRTASVLSGQNEDLRSNRSEKRDPNALEKLVDTHLKGAYSEWATSILQAMHCEKLGQQSNDDRAPLGITAHIFKNRDLEAECKNLADQTFSNGSTPVFQLTLDEQIAGDGELGISRLFDRNGSRANTEKGDPIYVARPEKDPIETQLATLHSNIQQFKATHHIQGKVPVVLLEDNVRHARMLNKVVQILNASPSIKALIQIKGIATEFCCASEEELSEIKVDGDPTSSAESIPTEPVIRFDLNYREIVDVTTPRDFFFDGLVVKLDNESIGRMPSFYVDEKNDLTDTTEKTTFISTVKSINSNFCTYLDTHLGIQPLIGWFRGGTIIQSLENDTNSESSSENSVRLSDPIHSILGSTEEMDSQAA